MNFSMVFAQHLTSFQESGLGGNRVSAREVLLHVFVHELIMCYEARTNIQYSIVLYIKFVCYIRLCEVMPTLV